MATRGTYAKGRAKQGKILDAALALTARKGFKETSIQEIADEVGLSQPGVLYHFPSRDSLFIEVLRRHDQNALDASRLTGPGAAAGWEHRDVSGFVQELASLMRTNAATPGLVEIYSYMAVAASDATHEAHCFFVERREMIRREYSGALRRMQEIGLLPAELDADAIALALHALADGLQLLWLSEPELDMGAPIINFLQALGAPAAPPVDGADER